MVPTSCSPSCWHILSLGGGWAPSLPSAHSPRSSFPLLASQTFWTLLVGAGSIVYTVGYILLLHTTVSHQQKSPQWPARQPLLGIASDFHISNEQKYSKQSKTEQVLAPCPLTYIFNVQEAGKSYSWGWLVFVGLGLGRGVVFNAHCILPKF